MTSIKRDAKHPTRSTRRQRGARGRVRHCRRHPRPRRQQGHSKRGPPALRRQSRLPRGSRGPAPGRCGPTLQLPFRRASRRRRRRPLRRPAPMTTPLPCPLTPTTTPTQFVMKFDKASKHEAYLNVLEVKGVTREITGGRVRADPLGGASEAAEGALGAALGGPSPRRPRAARVVCSSYAPPPACAAAAGSGMGPLTALLSGDRTSNPRPAGAPPPAPPAPPAPVRGGGFHLHFSLPAPQTPAEEDSGKFVPVAAFECRGLEPMAYHPEVPLGWHGDGGVGREGQGGRGWVAAPRRREGPGGRGRCA
jgi:hypothetical protein